MVAAAIVGVWTVGLAFRLLIRVLNADTFHASTRPGRNLRFQQSGSGLIGAISAPFFNLLSFTMNKFARVLRSPKPQPLLLLAVIAATNAQAAAVMCPLS